MAPPANPYARPLGPAAAAGWAAAFLVVYSIAGTVLATVRPGSEYDAVNGSLLNLASALVVLVAIARVHAPDGSIRDIVAARPVGFVPALISTVMGAAALAPLDAVQGLITRRWPTSAARSAEILHGLAVLSRHQRIAGTFMALLLVPLADELLFRGALATGVARDKGRRVALVTTSAVFGLVYSVNDLHYLPVYIALGLLLGHARFCTGSVLAPIGTYIAWRATDLAQLAWRFGSFDPLTTDVMPPIAWAPETLIGSTVVLAACVALLSRMAVDDERDQTPPPAAVHDARPTGSDEDEDDDA